MVLLPHQIHVQHVLLGLINQSPEMSNALIVHLVVMVPGSLMFPVVTTVPSARIPTKVKRCTNVQRVLPERSLPVLDRLPALNAFVAPIKLHLVKEIVWIAKWENMVKIGAPYLQAVVCRVKKVHRHQTLVRVHVQSVPMVDIP